MTVDVHLRAKYTETGVSRYRGNPFIEALPPLPKTKSELLTCTANYPDPPTAAVRRAGEVIRIAELRMLSDLRLPLPEYHRASIALTIGIREPYVPRNPMTVSDVRRRHEVAGATSPARCDSALELIQSRAVGYTVVAQTGMGKTTHILSVLKNYRQVIHHREYLGRPIVCVQITYLILRCPHDGTLKSLCLQFFEQVDAKLGTAYLKQAVGVRGIAPMVMLMKTVATQISLGLIVIDELQNLHVAGEARAELMLSLFSDLLEKVGVSLFVLATPAVQSVLEKGVRNIRKLTTSGDLAVAPFKEYSPQWKAFTDAYWTYSFTRNHGTLTSAVRRAWWNASGGNYAFAAAAFYLAQVDAIGGTEKVDEVAFQRVSTRQMAFLRPAISALRSGNPRSLQHFDDLILKKPYERLRSLVGVQQDSSDAYPNQEFEEEAAARERTDATLTGKSQKKTRQQRQRQSGEHPVCPAAFARENPLRP